MDDATFFERFCALDIPIDHYIMTMPLHVLLAKPVHPTS
jgi:hypothetical protein